MKSRLLVAAAVSLFGFAPMISASEAAIVDFQDSGGTFINNRVSGQAGSFTDQGLTFATAQGYMYTVDGSLGSPEGVNNGSNFLIDGYGSSYGYGSTTITNAAGRPFSVNSIDLGISYYGSSPQQITLLGHVSGGGTVTDPVTINNASFVTFNLAGFRNLTSLDILRSPTATQRSTTSSTLSQRRSRRPWRC
jgi:hypothetical protein